VSTAQVRVVFRRVRDVQKATSLLSTFSRSASNVCLDYEPNVLSYFRYSKPKYRVQFPGERGAARPLRAHVAETATVYDIETRLASRHSCSASER